MKSNLKKVWVNPVERISYQGRHKQVYTVSTSQGIIPTVSMRKTREDTTAAYYQFPYNPNTQKLETGLNTLVQNPFEGMSAQDILVSYKLSTSWQPLIENLTQKSEIKKQTLFEIRHGVEPDLYTDTVSYTMTQMPSDLSQWGKKSFLQSLNLTLYPRPNPFDNSTPRQELLMEMVTVLPQIAKTKNEVNSAYHDWYVSEEKEAEAEMAKKQEKIEEAMYYLHKLKKEYGQFITYQMAIILRDAQSQHILKGKVSHEGVCNALSEYVSPKNKYQIKNIENFMKGMKLLETKEGRELLDIEYLVNQALNTNIINKRDNRYIWHSKAGTPDVYDLGSSFREIVNFFYKEYTEFAPDTEFTNWYRDLREEVKAKNIQLD